MKTKEKANGVPARNLIELVSFWAFLALTAAAFVYCIVLLAQSASGGESVGTALNHLFMAALGALFLWLPFFAQKLFKLYFPPYLLILFYLFVYIHFVPGEVFRLYDKSFFFDKVLHTLSGILAACTGVSLGYAFMRPENGEKPTSAQVVGILLFGFFTALAVEFLWECAEFTCDRIGTSNMQRYKDGIIAVNPDGSVVSSLDYGTGLRDTMWDMLVTVFGALGVSVAALVILLKRPQWLERNTACLQKRFLEKSAEAEKNDAPLPSPQGEAKKSDFV